MSDQCKPGEYCRDLMVTLTDSQARTRRLFMSDVVDLKTGTLKDPRPALQYKSKDGVSLINFCPWCGGKTR